MYFDDAFVLFEQIKSAHWFRVFTNYESFIPTYQKRGLLHILLHNVVISRHLILKSIIWRLLS